MYILGVELKHIEDLVVGSNLLVMDNHKLLRMSVGVEAYVEVIIYKTVVNVILHHLEVLFAGPVQYIARNQVWRQSKPVELLLLLVRFILFKKNDLVE